MLSFVQQLREAFEYLRSPMLLAQELKCLPYHPARQRIPKPTRFDGLLAIDIYTELEKSPFHDIDFETFLFS
jgi:hypothetical protein